MFDIRTTLILTIFYNLLLGISMVFFAVKKKHINGIIAMGQGLIAIGVGILFLSYRDYLGEFYTIILANFLIIFGTARVLHGLTSFKKLSINWLYQDGLSFAMFIIGFIYFTYAHPSVNARIIIIATFLTLYHIKVLYVLNYKNKKLIRTESHLISVLYVISIVVNTLRISEAIYGATISNFMAAGTIHAVGIIIHQLLPLNLILGVFWISNTLYEHELETQAMTDSLTGLYNRAAIFKLGDMEFMRQERNLSSVGVVLCDIDYFKIVNDTHGHLMGDQVIESVAQIIKNNIRSSDFAGRYGGDEFVLIIPEIDQDQLHKLLENLRVLLEKYTITLDKETISVTMSFGAIIITEQPYNFEETIRKSDEAMYEAKREGRNKIVFFAEK